MVIITYIKVIFNPVIELRTFLKTWQWYIIHFLWKWVNITYTLGDNFPEGIIFYKKWKYFISCLNKYFWKKLIEIL